MKIALSQLGLFLLYKRFMKNWIHKIQLHRNFLLFITVFAYVQSVYGRISFWDQIDAYTFTPDAALGSLLEAAVIFTITLYYLRKWQTNGALNSKAMLKVFSLSILSHLIAMKILGLIVSLLFNTVEKNFNLPTFMISLFSNFLNGIIYGSFFLAYYYFTKNKTHQLQLATYHKALSESKINQLKSQLNPHFLFNNLNVLDQLIDEDKTIASDFLNKFADVYRFALQASEHTTIPISEELTFAKQYFELMHYKYGNAYQLELEIENKNSSGSLIPFTLQLLLENAIKHNVGTEKNPVRIKMMVNNNITVTNNLVLKRTTKPTTGKGLSNLIQQYNLLAGTPLQIQKTRDLFTVVVPVIYSKAPND